MTAAACKVSPADLVRHARRGPRYTSYPPATEFSADFGETEAAIELSRLAEGPREAVSVYAHIPYCSRLCWYCGCNVKVTRDRDRGTSYVDVLVREIAQLAGRLGSGWTLAELSLGGGSPNFLSIDDLARVTGAVLDVFAATADAELGIELDPRDASAEQVRALADLGYRRLSVGVQDFDEDVQATINRHQSVEETSELVALARRAGFSSVGVDLVYGLPGQSAESFARTLDAICQIEPERIALFGYAHLPQLRPHQKLVERRPIPGLDARAELLLRAIDTLVGAGYERVGFDHFARPADPLARAAREGRLRRNFQGFTVQRGGPLLAFGATGISDTGGAYWQNHASIEDWAQAVSSDQLPVGRGLALNDDDRLRREVINRLMCDGVLDLARISTAFGVDPESYFSAELDELQKAEWSPLVRIDRQARAVTPTELGRELIRNSCLVFDRYAAAREASARPAASTTV